MACGSELVIHSLVSPVYNTEPQMVWLIIIKEFLLHRLCVSVLVCAYFYFSHSQRTFFHGLVIAFHSFTHDGYTLLPIAS